MNPKILIGCPTSDAKAYCLNEFFNGLKSLTYECIDVCLEDNSEDSLYFNRLKELAKEWDKGKFDLIHSGFTSPKAMERIIKGRNKLREKVLNENYDYFLSLEQDIIPPPNLIESLLRHGKKVVSGTYMNTLPGLEGLRVIAYRWHEKPTPQEQGKIVSLSLLDVLPSRLIEVSHTGLGCLLIHRSMLDGIEFRKEGTTTDDIWFCKDVREKKNEKIYLDSSMFCQHLLSQSFKRSDF